MRTIKFANDACENTIEAGDSICIWPSMDIRTIKLCLTDGGREYVEIKDFLGYIETKFIKKVAAPCTGFEGMYNVPEGKRAEVTSSKN